MHLGIYQTIFEGMEKLDKWFRQLTLKNSTGLYKSDDKEIHNA